MNDIKDENDIKLLVDSFYSKVQQDELLAPIFGSRIQGDEWEKHLNRMYGFWNTVLFFQRTYKGNPFAKHIDLPITEHHFERWIELFSETIDTHFDGEKADETKRRADNIAKMFKTKMAIITKKSTYKALM